MGPFHHELTITLYNYQFIVYIFFYYVCIESNVKVHYVSITDINLTSVLQTGKTKNEAAAQKAVTEKAAQNANSEQCEDICAMSLKFGTMKHVCMQTFYNL